MCMHITYVERTTRLYIKLEGRIDSFITDKTQHNIPNSKASNYNYFQNIPAQRYKCFPLPIIIFSV